ncbi:MAG: DNA sulfur modification protein DndD [Verrucomicrobiales bacterium]
MILDRILLDNFGAYGGRQEAHLTPEPGKPVILFGGMNGGGKTTFLDALQLGLYGRKARTSNRGNKAYLDYLSQCIHRGSDPKEGASITIRFHRISEGKLTNYEVQRAWKDEGKGVQENLLVLCDGLPDEILTEHWEEHQEAHLPSSIAHLFFFDGEQIAELADGSNAAKIIGTAIHTLLGLDLVDRLENDLRVFERRKRAESLDAKGLEELKSAEATLQHIDEEEAAVAMEEGSLVNRAGRLAQSVEKARDDYEAQGGALFERHAELEATLHGLQAERSTKQQALRELAAGPLPLLLIAPQLAELQQQVHHETEIRHAKVLSESLEERDAKLTKLLKAEKASAALVKKITKHLDEERDQVASTAGEELVIDADPNFEAELIQLRQHILPATEAEATNLLKEIDTLSQRIDHVDTELARVPAEDQIAGYQQRLTQAQKEHQTALRELEDIKTRRESLRRQHQQVSTKVERLTAQNVDARYAEKDRERMLAHSPKVRKTLADFKTRVIRKHASKIESLMLESFQSLLRKTDLVSGLTIDPKDFTVTLLDRNKQPLPFDRLSAGERQLLATSMLWGLARASGRPVPTIIDTPLGRLDSSHRTHLVTRYFPSASHQVLLLSTDEEIVGNYHEALKPYVSRQSLAA